MSAVTDTVIGAGDEFEAVRPRMRLEELVTEEQGGGGTSTLYMIAPAHLRIEEGYNLRDVTTPERKQYIEDLAASVAANGMRKPIMVRMQDGVPVVVDGECRTRAALLAVEKFGATDLRVPCLTEPQGTSEAERVAMMTYADNRADPLTPLEVATGIARLIGFGWTQDNIAKRFGISQQRVAQLRDIAALPDEVKAEIQAGNISAKTAATVIKADPAEGASRITAATSKNKGNSRRVANSLLPGSKRKSAAASMRAKVDAVIVTMAAEQKKALAEQKKTFDERLQVLTSLFLKGRLCEDGNIVKMTYQSDIFGRLCAEHGVSQGDFR